MTDPIRGWARRYGDELDRVPHRTSSMAQRARILMAHRSKRKGGLLRFGRLALPGSALALALVAALAFLIHRPKGGDLSGPALSGDPVGQGTEIRTRDAQRELTFPQGSRAIWRKSSQGSLSKYSENVVELKLDAGSLEMDVVHRAGRTWLVRAGNFRVYVVGTAFLVDYDPATEAIQVRVDRGRVRVEGPHISGDHLMLQPGERFTWRPEDHQVSPTVEKEEQSKAEPDADADPSAQVSASAPSQLPVAKQDGHGSSWRELARQRKYDEAVEAVERHGVGRVVSESGPDDLVLLGNAARYTGRIALAQRAYGAARRTPGPAATLSAYYLAKTALDTKANDADAIRWLRIYLQEARRGSLAASARARLMSLLERTGDRAGAVAVAKEYLAEHPEGPHAPLAQNLVGAR